MGRSFSRRTGKENGGKRARHDGGKHEENSECGAALRKQGGNTARLLEEIVCSFELKEEEFAYELKLRSRLSDIWCQLLSLAEPMPPGKGISEKMNDKAKLMLAYIHENYSEKISIREIAAAAYVSERESFRTFRECLHMTPAAYLLDYRLQNACRMLTSGEDSITQIGHACGLGSSSYFGKTFRTRFGCTPLEYRHKWRDLDKNRQ